MLKNRGKVFFNSLEFIYAFLPLTLVLYYFTGKYQNGKFSVYFLAIASMIFYIMWSMEFFVLLITSVIFNFFSGRALFYKRSKVILTISIVLNLGVLGYFKYANFFIDNINRSVGSDLNFINIILPLGISFFTFTQISFLFESYRHKTEEKNLIRYILFVTFFPQISAGPIVYHSEMSAQYKDESNLNLKMDNLSIGMVIFALGLFKKTVLADNLGFIADPIFNSGTNVIAGGFSKDISIDLINSWKASLAYTFQLYFDFSGYTDMSLGIAHALGIKLPHNFYSPYKAKSIVEFWKRWHMTLSRFFRDYVFLPVSYSLSRKLKYGSLLGSDMSIYVVGILVTWSLTGLWHGAGWTFIAWGVFHAIYLIINRIVKKPKRKFFKYIGVSEKGTFFNVFYIIITFLAVHIAWVYFRSPDFFTANYFIRGMSGFNGFMNSSTDLQGFRLIIFASAIAFFMPNSLEFLSDYKIGIATYGKTPDTPTFNILRFKFSYSFSFYIAVILIISMIFVHSVQKMGFLYNDF